MKNERKTLYSTINPASITHEKKKFPYLGHYYLLLAVLLSKTRPRHVSRFPDRISRRVTRQRRPSKAIYIARRKATLYTVERVDGGRRRRVSSVFISKSFIKKHIRLSTPPIPESPMMLLYRTEYGILRWESLFCLPNISFHSRSDRAAFGRISGDIPRT